MAASGDVSYDMKHMELVEHMKRPGPGRAFVQSTARRTPGPGPAPFVGFMTFMSFMS